MHFLLWVVLGSFVVCLSSTGGAGSCSSLDTGTSRVSYDLGFDKPESCIE